MPKRAWPTTGNRASLLPGDPIANRTAPAGASRQIRLGQQAVAVEDHRVDVHRYAHPASIGLAGGPGWGIPHAGPAVRLTYTAGARRQADSHDRDTRTDQAIRICHCCLGADVHRPARRGHRVPRPQRRREVHHDADDRGPGRTHLRNGSGERQAAAGARRAAAGTGRHARPAGRAPQPLRLPPPARPRPDLRHPPRPGGRAHRGGRPGRRGQPRRGQVLPGHVPAAGHRRRAARRPAHE